MAVLGLLAACQSNVPAPVADLGDPNWSLNGRIGIVAGDQSGSFGLDWQQTGRELEIDLFGPFGIGLARVQSERGLYTLSLPGESPITANSAEELLFRATGMIIPVSPMRYWVRGNPAPGRFERMAQGFRQSGWRIEYSEYEGRLPTRIRVSRPEARLTLVVRRWGA